MSDEATDELDALAAALTLRQNLRDRAGLSHQAAQTAMDGSDPQFTTKALS